MAQTTSKTFRSGNSEAVRLPRDLAFGADVELTLIRSGDVLTIYPSKGSIVDLVATLNQMPRPDSVERRDEDLFPERPGL
ncbi:MAG: antitoxin [Caulobacter vibrioides]|uniref:Antitoxin n=1 Tax=Caulobacter vibrioides TaxID=155892 RepID=A0A258DF77_CAUVI|nr:MAG: antitoxin [Caulobacter vibrioides]